MPPKGKHTSSKTASTSQRGKRAREASPPPPPLPWPLVKPSHQARYQTLAKRPIIPSKFFDMFTVHQLGLRDEVTTFLGNIGWINFSAIQHPTYREITYEILSSFQADYDPHAPQEQHCISFRCLGENRRLTMHDFNSIFGFSSDGVDWFPQDFIADHAWYYLTGEPLYDPGRSKASLLQNHALRYIHRVMSSSIFGRGESTGVVNKVELFFLHAMSKAIPINTGAWFIRHITHITKQPTGKICIGGLLSIIAAAFGFDPVEGVHRTVDGSNRIDIETLKNMRMCRHIGGGTYRLLDVAGQVIQPDIEDPYDVQEDAQFQEQGAHADPADFPESAAEFPDQTAEASYFPAQSSSDFQMSQIMHRFERIDMRFDQIDARMAQQEETHRQMMAFLQRIEDKLP